VLLTSIHAGLGVLPPPGPPSMPASKSHKPPGAPVYGAGSFMDTSVGGYANSAQNGYTQIWH